MCAPGFEPRASIALPTAMIGPMAAEASVNAMYAKKIAEIADPAERDAFTDARLAEQRADLDLLRLASELVVDAVVEPASCAPSSSRGWPPRRAGPAPRGAGTTTSAPSSEDVHGRQMLSRAARPPRCSPLREQWRSAAPGRAAAHRRARHADSPDAYWAWVAERQRWMRPWDTVRTGELGDFSYFAGGQINVADNCVDRWAQDPATAGRAAVIWEGEPGDVRTVSYAELAGEVQPAAPALASLGVTKGDVVGDLHAERGRGVHRRARVQPDRRHLHDPVLRLRPGRRRCPGWRRRAPRS